MDVVLADFKTLVNIPGIVAFRELLDFAAVFDQSIVFERVEDGVCSPGNVIIVQAWLILHLERGQGKVVSLGLAHHELVVFVDIITS